MASHDTIEHAGYLTYIFLLSIFPFIVLLASIAGFIGESEYGKDIIGIFIDGMPQNVQATIKPRINEILSGPTPSILTIAILGAIWTASSTFEALRTTFNRAFRVKSPPAYLFRRALSILQFLLFTLMLMFTIFCMYFIPILISKFSHITGIPENFWHHFAIFRSMFLFIILILCVASLYLFLPNIKLKINNVLPGAILVVMIWHLFGIGFTKYIAYFRQINFIYGSLEGIIITLIYFFISNIILIAGAEFNYNFNKIVKFDDK